MKLICRFLGCLFVLSSFAIKAEGVAQVVGPEWEFKEILLDETALLVDSVVKPGQGIREIESGDNFGVKPEGESEVKPEIKPEIKSSKNMQKYDK